MKLNEKAVANSLAITSAGFFILCAAFIALFPGLSQSVYASWFHGLDISGIWSPGRGTEPGSFLLGLVTFSAVMWAAGYVFTLVYNASVKK